MVIIWHAAFVVHALPALANDSIYSLRFIHQLGLIVLSAVLITSVFWASDTLSDWILQKVTQQPIPNAVFYLVDLLLTYLLFSFFYIGSAQIYYLYYTLILPDLPWQWVVNSREGFTATFEFLAMFSVDSYAKTIAALALWTLLVQASFKHLIVRVKHINSTNPIAVGAGFGAGCFTWLWFFCRGSL